MMRKPVIIKPFIEIKRAIQCLKDEDCNLCWYLSTCRKIYYKKKLGFQRDKLGNWIKPERLKIKH